MKITETLHANNERGTQRKDMVLLITTENSYLLFEVLNTRHVVMEIFKY